MVTGRFIPTLATLFFTVILALPVTAPIEAAEYKLKLPLGLQEQAAYVPDNNPLTPEKISLGKQFFWDKRWSKSGTVACVSCHPPDKGWADGRQFSINFAGKPTPRHAPVIVNRLFSDVQLWHGLRKSLEDQALNDANTSPDAVVQNLNQIPEYREKFRMVFGTEITADGVAKAIASYVRTILSGNSPFDRSRAGDKKALSASAQRGLTLFEGKANCFRCHASFNFTDESYHNLGVGMDKEKPDLGRHLVTKAESDRGAFKTPTLRDVAKSAPYMHDGSLKTLEEVVAFYNKGGHKNPWLSKEIRPLGLTASEQADLVEFMRSLTGEIDTEVSSRPQLP
ncbi:MAG: c-type cytochrome [Deltaproteobacteria bacterium]|nr:c-type cytochrome [Deltaproteobacteria bacterium]